MQLSPFFVPYQKTKEFQRVNTEKKESPQFYLNMKSNKVQPITNVIDEGMPFYGDQGVFAKFGNV